MQISDNADGVVRRGLTLAANLWAERGRSKAKTDRIRQMIEVGQVQSLGQGKWQIEIKNKAPEAAAYEFGSGLTSTKRAPARYLIKSKSGKMLHFFMPEALNIESPRLKPGPDGEVFLPLVMHPGVKPEPHMKPALDEVKDQMRQVIGQEFLVNVVHKSIREAWLAK